MASIATKLVIDSDLIFDGLYTSNNTALINDAFQKIADRWGTRYTLGTSVTSAQANVIYSKEIILAGASQNFDLNDGLIDLLFQNVTMTKLKLLYIKNLADPDLTPAYSLTVSGNLFAGIGTAVTSFSLMPGDDIKHESPIEGYTVTDTSQERITLNPGANAFHVRMLALGIQ